jgi:hypothetical protein
MGVISFHFDKFNIEKKKELEAPIKVEIGMRVIDVKEEDISLGSGKSEKVLRFFYEYKAEYQPNQAQIIICGNLVYFEPEEDLKKVSEEWTKTKRMNTDITRSIMNNVLMRCQIKALSLGQDIGLPPQIKLPLVTKKAAKADYTG